MARFLADVDIERDWGDSILGSALSWASREGFTELTGISAREYRERYMIAHICKALSHFMGK